MAQIGQWAWYYDPNKSTGLHRSHDEKPFPALIVDTSDDGKTVNLVAYDHHGTAFPLQGVPLRSSDDEDDPTSAYCSLDAPASPHDDTRSDEVRSFNIYSEAT
jgi:hypothetical protein